ncbi:MAG: ATP-binding cassette domain-containing protein, partial [Plesiomonas shigelloides]
LLAGELAPLHGVVELSRGIKLGYFAQHQLETLHPEESPLVHLARLAPRETEQQLRDYLGGFGFRGDKVTDPVAPFSGGEKARLVLALIVWQRPNLLLLDEPTNHLDLDMRQALTEALIDFDGAMVVVSHDRHLLRSTTDDLYLVHDGQVELFRGDLDDYQRWLSEEQKREQQDSPATSSAGDKDNTNSAQARKEQKRREAEFRQQTQPLRRQLTKLEKELETLTSKLQEVETQLADPALYDASQKVRMTELLSLQVSTKNALEETEMAWLDAQSELENLQQAFDALS